ncbi:MAG: hypothetical protein ABF651_06780 [Sporolactobacillus sp.]
MKIEQMSPQEQTAFAAYTHLTVGNRAQAEANGISVDNGQNQLSFTDFEKDVNGGKVVNQGLSRDLSDQDKALLQKELKNYSSSQFNAISTVVEEAYKLGLADQNGILISRNQVLSSYQNSV